MRAQLYSYIRGRRLHSVQQFKKYIHVCYAVLFYRINKTLRIKAILAVLLT
jgi:hypothetical protein